MPGSPDARFPRLAKTFLGPPEPRHRRRRDDLGVFQEVSVSGGTAMLRLRSGAVAGRARALTEARHMQAGRTEMSIQRFETGPRMSQVVVHGNTVYLAGVVATRRQGRKRHQADPGNPCDHRRPSGEGRQRQVEVVVGQHLHHRHEEFRGNERGVGQLGVAGQYAGARHRRGEARLPAIQRRDHGGRGEVAPSRRENCRPKAERRPLWPPLFFHELTLRARRSFSASIFRENSQRK